MKKISTVIAVVALCFAAVAAWSPTASASVCEGSAGYLREHVKKNRVVWTANKWAVDDGVDPAPDHYTWAMYADIKIGKRPVQRYPLKVTATYDDDPTCLYYAVRATAPWNGQRLAAVNTYGTDGQLGATEIYRLR